MNAGKAKQSLPRMIWHNLVRIFAWSWEDLFCLKNHGVRLERMKYEHFRQTDG
jgi:hypothetical protein